MKVPELFTQFGVEPFDFEPFLRRDLRKGMPPLDTTRLAIESVIGRRKIDHRHDTVGDGSLVLRYKNRTGAVLGFNEEDDGETWDVFQVQGTKSQKSYRVASGLKWADALSKRLSQFANAPEARVRQVIMNPLHGLENIDGAVSKHVDETYGAVKRVFGMRFSKDSRKFIADIR